MGTYARVVKKFFASFASGVYAETIFLQKELFFSEAGVQKSKQESKNLSPFEKIGIQIYPVYPLTLSSIISMDVNFQTMTK